MIKIYKKLIKSRAVLRIKEKLYPKYSANPLLSCERNLSQAMERYRASESKKKPSQIKKEIDICRKFWKCYPYHYFMYDLYKNERNLTREELTNFIPEFFWYYLYLPHENDYRFHMITANKILTDQYFRSLNIPQIDTLCFVIKGKLFSVDMSPISFDQIHEKIIENNYQKIFIKPAESQDGEGILIFNKNSGYKDTNGNFLDENILKRLGTHTDFIIQPGLVQDQVISSIYPDSVNTFRIITENKNGVTKNVCAMLRMGRGKKEVDNASAGGVFSKVDVNNGRLGNMAMSYDCERFEEHPDTFFKFPGYIVPKWNAIAECARMAAEKLPYFTHLGWDVSLTPSGPVVIETNTGIGITAIQMVNDGLRDKFQISDPDYYWNTKGKR